CAGCDVLVSEELVCIDSIRIVNLPPPEGTDRSSRLPRGGRSDRPEGRFRRSPPRARRDGAGHHGAARSTPCPRTGRQVRRVRRRGWLPRAAPLLPPRTRTSARVAWSMRTGLSWSPPDFHADHAAFARRRARAVFDI